MRTVALVVPVLSCVLVSAGHSAEVGTLDPAGRHGLGAMTQNGQFTLEAFAQGGGFSDRSPGRPLATLEGLLALVPEGGFGRSRWRLGSPMTDNWSARFTGTLRVAKEGEYTFYYTTDDGARLWVDDKQIVNDWVPRPGLTSEVKATLTAGDHPVRAEFFEQGGSAQAHLEWSGPDLKRQVVPAEVMSSDGKPGWKAEYFDNMELKGEAKVRPTPTLDFNWGDGGPEDFGGQPPWAELNWARLSDAAVVLRLSGPASARIGLVVQSAGAEPFVFRGQGGELVGVANAAGDREPVRFRLRPLSKGVALQAANPSDLPGAWAPGDQPALFLAGCGELPKLNAESALEALRKAMLTGANAPFPTVGPDGWASLFNGRDLTGWRLRHEGGKQSWSVRDGVLVNQGRGTDLYSEVRLTDFELHIEFMVPKGSNSGVYLQGRYEIQVLDSFGQGLNPGMCGAIYGKAVPSENASKPAGEWQTFDAKFRGARPSPEGGPAQHARLTVIHNSKRIIDDVELDGVTGGAMDADEWRAYGIMLQGDHGAVEYRNIKVRPVTAGGR